MLFHLPVKPRVFYFLQNFCKGKPLRLPATGEIPSFIFFCIRASKTLQKYQYVKSCPEYSSTFPIEIPAEYVFNYGIIEIGPEAVVQINHKLEADFEQHFYYELAHRKFVKKQEIKSSIMALMEEWGIDENVLAWETLVKDFYRFRKKKQNIFQKIDSGAVPSVYTNSRYQQQDAIYIKIEKGLKKKFFKTVNNKGMRATPVLQHLIQNYVTAEQTN